jgi:outer membrane protein assembly factor BamE (lipoprotein component of BamABCDE complex)
MARRFLGVLLSGLAVVLLTACDGINLGTLQPGLSTEQDVRAAMGEPTMEWQDADGTVTWEYPRTPYGVVNYMIVFDPDRRLREVRQVLTEENFARVEAGMTREQIRRLLGKPAHEYYFHLKKEHRWSPPFCQAFN